MTVLTDRLAEDLGDRLACDTAAVALQPLEGSRWKVALESPRGSAEVTARAVVVSAPADVAAGLVAPLHAEAATLLREVPYAPVASVFLGFRAADVAHPLDGFGFLVPAAENRGILGTIFSSSLFDNRAPEDSVALTTFVGGMRRPELALDVDEGEIVERVADELREIIGVRGVHEFSHVVRWERAIPQYALGHHNVARAIDDLETQYSGLFFCTNYRGGVSVGDCIDFASTLSTRVIQHTPARDSL
jgi:oxygen-dependent protoporphyrinogen oxidase